MGPKGAVEILFRKEITESDDPQAATDAQDRRVRGEVRASVHRGRPRLPRRHHRSARHAAAPDRRARDAAHEARPESAEEARQHSAVTLASRSMFYRRSSSPIAARSRCASSAPAASWASHRSRSTATPTRARRTSARPTKRCTSDRAPSAESYLNGDRIIEAAQATSAPRRFIPGYGFLSEREWFARAVRDAGLVFIGPPAEAIAAMGSKTAARTARDRRERARRARERRKRCATPTKRARSPSSSAIRCCSRPRPAAAGRACASCASASELARALDAARREAKNAFGDDAVYVEKYIVGPRHVEIQVLGDQHGNDALARRARVLGAAPASEDDRGGAERRGHARASTRDGRDGRARRERRRLRERRHLRVPARPRRASSTSSR